jgi:hypothetical protein
MSDASRDGRWVSLSRAVGLFSRPIDEGIRMSEKKRPRLRVVKGGKEGRGAGSVRIEVATPETALSVDAVVLEEDTWLILSAAPEVVAPREHPIRLFTQLYEAEPCLPGAVLVRDEQPLTLLAVVHDFGADPCCQLEWIAAVLGEILRICRERRVVSILLPLFGVRHGAMKRSEIVPLIIGVLRKNTPPSLSAIYLYVPPLFGSPESDIL